jgi:hypothetical protein
MQTKSFKNENKNDFFCSSKSISKNTSLTYPTIFEYSESDFLRNSQTAASFNARKMNIVEEKIYRISKHCWGETIVTISKFLNNSSGTNCKAFRIDFD